MTQPYTDPVAKLLTLARCDIHHQNDSWPDYLGLGFTSEHVPELIRIATDMELNKADGESLEVWAPLHAWRILGLLKAEAAAGPLVRLFDQLEHDDWLPVEMKHILPMIGPGAISELEVFLADETVDAKNRIALPECLEKMALAHPAHRQQCVDVLVRQLERFRTSDPALNAFITLSLADLRAVEALDLIRVVYAEKQAELMVAGDIQDVEIMMGVRDKRSSPRPRLSPLLDMFGGGDVPVDSIANPHRSVGRNDPCPCGSGKKFKKCCLH